MPLWPEKHYPEIAGRDDSDHWKNQQHVMLPKADEEH
jgi:hypothetical protein